LPVSAARDTPGEPNLQKFFGSSFQKRTASWNAAMPDDPFRLLARERFHDHADGDYDYAGWVLQFRGFGRGCTARRYDDTPGEFGISWLERPRLLGLSRTAPWRAPPYGDPLLAAVVHALLAEVPGARLTLLCRDGYQEVNADRAISATAASSAATLG
jgi:hypothetical protein